jgi:selenocysteine lyase/cysteine desulfurase
VTDTVIAWTSGPARHEAGTPNLIGIIALATACQALERIGFETIEQHESALAERLDDRLTNLPGVRLHTAWPSGQPRIGVATFTVPGIAPGLAAAALSAEYGIGIRDGAFCAHLLVDHLLSEPGSPPGTALRASVGLGSSSDEIDRLASALERLTRGGPAWSYRELNGRVVPDPDPRPLESFLDHPVSPSSPEDPAPPRRC